MGAEHRADLSAEQRLAGEDRFALANHPLGVAFGLGVLDKPVGGASLSQLAQVGDHPLVRALARAYSPNGRDLRAEREDRLALQAGPTHRLRGTDAPAAVQVFQGVQAEPDVEARAGSGD